MSYDGQALKIWAIDENRGEAMFDIQKELSEKEPRKLTARRSSLIEFDKLNAHAPPPIRSFFYWTVKNSESIMDQIRNLSGKKKKTKNSCDHMSLYRARRMYYKTFQTASIQIREGVPANNNEWGSIPGVTIRLKVQGSDYNHCKVLVGK